MRPGEEQERERMYQQLRRAITGGYGHEERDRLWRVLRLAMWRMDMTEARVVVGAAAIMFDPIPQGASPPKDPPTFDGAAEEPPAGDASVPGGAPATDSEGLPF